MKTVWGWLIYLMGNNQPNYRREAPSCNNCIFVCVTYNPGCQVTDYYCNIDYKHPKLIDDCGICDNHKREM